MRSWWQKTGVVFCIEKLHPALLRVNIKAQHVYNQDESGYFRSFLVNIGKVWARKGKRSVARRCAYDRTHITALVCVSVARKTARPALLWTEKTVATQSDRKKDKRKAASDTNYLSWLVVDKSCNGTQHMRASP